MDKENPREARPIQCVAGQRFRVMAALVVLFSSGVLNVTLLLINRSAPSFLIGLLVFYVILCMGVREAQAVHSSGPIVSQRAGVCLTVCTLILLALHGQVVNGVRWADSLGVAWFVCISPSIPLVAWYYGVVELGLWSPEERWREVLTALIGILLLLIIILFVLANASVSSYSYVCPGPGICYG